MPWRQVDLANGLRLIGIERPGAPLVAIEAFVRAGSRYDRDGSGGAHLLEHLLFKGTGTRPAREIYAAVEGVGGAIEGHTAKEYVRLSAILPDEHVELGTAILADILNAPRLDAEDFWNEKLVVLQEIQRLQDNVNYIYHTFAQAMWPQHPLRYPVSGDVRRLAELDHAELLAFYARAYTAGNATVVLCGDLPCDAMLEPAVRSFGACPAGRALTSPAVDEPPPVEPRHVHLEKDLFQTHLLLGFRTAGLRDADRSALAVIERGLGLGGSARLFQRLREEKKLAYHVSTAMAAYTDTGYLAAHVTCSPMKVPEVKALLLQTFAELAEAGMTDEEIARAKRNYAGSLTRQFETHSALASSTGVEALLHCVEPLPNKIARVQRVTADEVKSVAQKYFSANGYVFATVGRLN